MSFVDYNDHTETLWIIERFRCYFLDTGTKIVKKQCNSSRRHYCNLYSFAVAVLAIELCLRTADNSDRVIPSLDSARVTRVRPLVRHYLQKIKILLWLLLRLERGFVRYCIFFFFFPFNMFVFLRTIGWTGRKLFTHILFCAFQWKYYAPSLKNVSFIARSDRHFTAHFHRNIIL